MPSVCLYFHVHQPYRVRPYHLFEVGYGKEYFDDEVNARVCRKVAEKCYLPANSLMLELIHRYPGQFKISYSITGVVLEQFEQYSPETLASFQALVATGQVELLAETYYHSLASLFDGEEFGEQVKLQQATLKKYFQQTPQIFRNTELIYSNGIADLVQSLGFKAMLTEGVDRILDWRSPNFVYASTAGLGEKNLKLLLKNYRLSDDIAFRFSDRSWKGWPLTAEKFAHWIHQTDGNGDTVNLFMDYETLGEHQWEDTGIFHFLRALPEALFRHPAFDFATPSEVIARYPSRGKISIPDAISWADLERDLSAWLGNPLQDGIVRWVYQLSEAIKSSGDPRLLHIWRKLQTSDHFYYMCTKYWSDGDVHRYFSAYATPHDPYVIMSNILSDLEIVLLKAAPPVPAKKRRSLAASGSGNKK